jgi:hypothetical protein
MREEEQKLNSNKGNSIERNYGKDIINEFCAVNLGESGWVGGCLVYMVGWDLSYSDWVCVVSF